MKMYKEGGKASGDKSSAGPGFVPTMNDTNPKALFEGSAGKGKSVKGDSEYKQVTRFGNEK
jgi:hypothetical protein